MSGSHVVFGWFVETARTDVTNRPHPREGFRHRDLIVYAVRYELATFPRSLLIVWLAALPPSAGRQVAMRSQPFAMRSQQCYWPAQRPHWHSVQAYRSHAAPQTHICR